MKSTTFYEENGLGPQSFSQNYTKSGEVGPRDAIFQKKKGTLPIRAGSGKETG